MERIRAIPPSHAPDSLRNVINNNMQVFGNIAHVFSFLQNVMPKLFWVSWTPSGGLKFHIIIQYGTGVQRDVNKCLKKTLVTWRKELTLV